jgi:hypothetical protein
MDFTGLIGTARRQGFTGKSAIKELDWHPS